MDLSKNENRENAPGLHEPLVRKIEIPHRIPFEGILLFFVLFFPAVYASGFSGITWPETIPFSIVRELGRTLTYSIPSLVLLWYLASDRSVSKISKFISPASWEFKKNLRKKDFFIFAVGLPGLILINISISTLLSIASRAYGLPSPPRMEAPVNALGWAVMIISCLGTGYLEESYFRYYLLSKLRRTLPSPKVRVFLATFLFAICHIHNGPFAVLNAALAGIFLSALFIRYRSLHGIAWAHAVHNMFVYSMGAFIP